MGTTGGVTQIRRPNPRNPKEGRNPRSEVGHPPKAKYLCHRQPSESHEKFRVFRGFIFGFRISPPFLYVKLPWSVTYVLTAPRLHSPLNSQLLPHVVKVFWLAKNIQQC